jgi:hypothetical protein
MSKENAIALGVAVGAVVLGGLGIRAFRNRQLKKAAANAMATAMANSTPQERAAVVQAVTRPAPAPAPKEVVQEPVKAEEPQVEVQPEVPEVETNNETIIDNDVVMQIVTDRQEEITSVSRIRLPEAGGAPVFWEAGQRKIRRPEVIALTEGDFDGGRNDYARGFHHCTLDGVAGILHVTKNNFSAVIMTADGEFHGISTSAAKFGGKKLSNISAERAKVFLNGN